MKGTCSIIGLITSLILVISIGCKKDNVKSTGFDLKQLKGGTWVEYSRQNPYYTPSMKFRFFNDSNVTYTYLSSIYPTVKYDSLANGKWKLFQPDTLRFYNASGNGYGGFRVIKITDTILYTKIMNYGDTTLFKRQY
jgi:hypothetical protein